MNPIIRNLFSTVRRFRLTMTLNILGISVAFSAFMVIMIQLDYDYGFDKFHKDSDKIFRLEFTRGSLWQNAVSRPLAEHFFESSPHIVAGAIGTQSPVKSFFLVENDGVRNFFEEGAMLVSPDFFDVFTFDFVEGSKDALKTPGNIIIPLSLSRKLFAKESAVDRQIVFESGGNQTVGAVYRDLPANTVVSNCIYRPVPEDENKHDWNNWNYQVYLRVNHPSNAALLVDNFKRTFDVQADYVPNFGSEASGENIRLTVLPDIHFITDVYDSAPKANRQTLMILFAIAIVIVAIAAINFTNFSTALTPMRIKNINTQRVLGVRRNRIRFSLVLEAVFACLLSYLVALCFVLLFNSTPLARLVDADLSLAANPLIVVAMALFALFVGFLAGVYPAFFTTSFAPALVLKGNFGLSHKGKKMRNTLIGIQFFASFTLIIGASFMYLQNHFMQNSPLGYDKDDLITVDVRRIQESREAFTNQLKAYSGIKDVTYGGNLLSSADAYTGMGVQYKGEQIIYQFLPVDHTFLDVMGIEVLEGRGFRQEDANAPQGVFVANETARKQLNLELNTFLFNIEIIGFMPDLKFASFRTAVEPMGFLMSGNQRMFGRYAYIKLMPGVNKRAVMSHIQTTLAAFDADYHFFEIRFFDEVLQRLYEKETSLSSLITLFSLLAIFISIVGVFGLVVFDSECRRKEIGIRKVLGASTMGIIIMFNKAYLKMLLICFVIAAPLAWYVITRWLENFAYKTPMYWWVYLLALVAVGIITACTVTFQNWRVANADPVKAIKSE